MTNAHPSIDPSNLDTLAGTFRAILGKLIQGIDGMLPAIVIAFDRAENRVQIQPGINIIATTKNQSPRAQIASIPVLQLGGGGFGIFFNLKPGDKGWIFAADRDTSLFLQGYKPAAPQTFRMKNFSDSLFIPDVMTGFTISGEDEANLVIQNKEGDVKISFFTDKIKITAPNVEIESPTKFTGDMYVDGNIAASGSITPNVPP